MKPLPDPWSGMHVEYERTASRRGVTYALIRREPIVDVEATEQPCTVVLRSGHFLLFTPERVREVRDADGAVLWSRAELDQPTVSAPKDLPDADYLRAYLRTVADTTSTEDQVDTVFHAMTAADQRLVSRLTFSWNSARMERAQALAPFMDRFMRMVRERDPQAQKEGNLLLAAFREDDPTWNTVQALLEIARAP